MEDIGDMERLDGSMPLPLIGEWLGAVKDPGIPGFAPPTVC